MLRFFRSKNLASHLLQQHFGPTKLDQLITARRTFPITARVDLQRALEKLFPERYPARLVGIHAEFGHETLSFAHMTNRGHYTVSVGPLQHDEVDIGEPLPARCLRHGLWLSRDGANAFAVLATPAERFGHNEGVCLEIAVRNGADDVELSRRLLDELERLVAQSGSYRGKVISLEALPAYHGRAGTVRVHKLQPVQRQDIVLPEKTLGLLERNVHDFIQQRPGLKRLGLAAKKGLLFYGPPGTGKTYTIHYLASQLRDHTTLLITSEQVGILDDYFQLARFLQPAMVVIEDIDLIARAREHMRSACEETLLNKLLNEMDGLREEAELLFVLTTNRPDQIEAALASRPGRIDQAIEFPLPDADGRRKLVHLYARGMTVPAEVADVVVRKTQKSSGAFIKELMRRSAQYRLQSGNDGSLELKHVEAALDEMLFGGGSLNKKLLGGEVEHDPA
jgi:hypothetical protein